MNIKKSLENRIRGWLPKEPIFPVHHKTTNKSTFQPQLGDTRIVSYVTPILLLLVLVVLFAVFTNITFGHTSFSWQAQWVILGITAGGAIGTAITQNQLFLLTKRGEIHIAKQNLLFILGCFSILLISILTISRLSSSVQIGWMNFFYLAVT